MKIEIETEGKLPDDEYKRLLDELQLGFQKLINLQNNRIQTNSFLYLFQGGAFVVLNIVEDNFPLNGLVCFLTSFIVFAWALILERGRLLIKFWGMELQELGARLGFTSLVQEATLAHLFKKVEFPTIGDRLKPASWQRISIMKLESALPIIYGIFWAFGGIYFVWGLEAILKLFKEKIPSLLGGIILG